MGVRVLYSFPHKIGAARVCNTAWQEVVGAAGAGADLTLFTGVVHRPLPRSVRIRTTLARGRWRIPYRALGQLRAMTLHDRIVARALPKLSNTIDVVHTWPLAGLETLRMAHSLGIPAVVERPNAHTRFAYEVVARECERLGVDLPATQEHAYNETRLHREEAEYALAAKLLCPSDFVVRTFRDQGFETNQLTRHTYGYDPEIYYPAPRNGGPTRGLEALFVGVCAVRKGLHFALESWLASSASKTGRFRIAGAFLPQYREKLARMLAHPSVQVLGHHDDVPELMRQSDVLLLPSLEEGSPLACQEAVASGCVPLISEACDGACVNENALVHRVGDVAALTVHINMLDEDRARLAELRAACLEAAPGMTWAQAGRRLLAVYEDVASGTASHSEACGSIR